MRSIINREPYFKDESNSMDKLDLNAHHYDIWGLIKIYWRSSHRLRAYLSYGFVLLLTISLVGLDVFFNYWYNHFYDALQAYNKAAVIKLLMVFFGVAFFYIIVAVYRYYVSQLFCLRWRKWLTEQLVTRWLQKRSYYLIENFDENTDNPDQRIQEDVGALVNSSLDLSLGLISAFTTFFAFIYILWQLSGILRIPLGPFGTITIHGYLVWVSLIYAGLGTFFTFKIGKPLVALNFEQQRREATFRYAAMDLRTHAEHVALYRGEEHQKGILNGLFSRVLDNWYLIILRQKLLLWFTAGYNQTSVVLPLIVALPNYFDKVFLLGGLIQSLQAFGRVQDSLSFIVNSYTSIAQWQATGRRLTTFVNHMNEVDANAKRLDRLKLVEENKPMIGLEEVSIQTPRGEALLANIKEQFDHQKNYLIKGISGIGKSTLVRAIAGIWPYAQGRIELPQGQSIMYLPQKPYMPIGTLAEAILFPDKEHPEMVAQLDTVMHLCHLDHLIPRLEETASWSEQLSPGEQQRVAFARVLLHKPDWVFLDESTSMLDIANEKYLYQMLKEKLPKCSIVSVGHRPTLDAYHDVVIDMEKYSCESRQAYQDA